MKILAESYVKQVALKAKHLTFFFVIALLLLKVQCFSNHRLNSKRTNSGWLMGTDSVISFFQWFVIIVCEIAFEAEPFLKCSQVINSTRDSGGKSQSITVLNRIKRNVVEVFVIVREFSRNDLHLHKILQCTHSIPHCLWSGSSEQSPS